MEILYNGNIIPIDPFNKTAISIHYLFPSVRGNFYEESSIEWYYKYLFMHYYSSLILELGSEENYNQIITFFDLLKKYYIDNGIPIIIDEVGILNYYKLL